VPDERFSEHLNHPVGRGHAVAGGHAGSAGGSICGDIVRIDVRVEGETVADAGFEAAGCGALTAAASACVDLVRGTPLLQAARVGSSDVPTWQPTRSHGRWARQPSHRPSWRRAATACSWR
jgi:tRNA-specific 2-thiouridylase